MLRVLTLSTLFPDVSRPNFGPFVERQTRALAARPDVEVRVVAPLGIPRLGNFHPRYRSLAALPEREDWEGLGVHRPRFAHVPWISARVDPVLLARALRPMLHDIRRSFAFDVIDAQYFFPDGPAAVALGREFGVPVSIKARGSDIHLWAGGAARAGIVAAGCAADGLLAVSEALKADMAALGMPTERIRVHRTGVDHARFRVRDRIATKAVLGVAGPLIVSVGALVERKGQDLVIGALPQLRGATLVLVGAGEGRGRYEALAARLGVSDRVRFTGSIGANAIANWLAAADVMALPSASEGLANAWVEALASGTPIVIADVGGARELLTEPAGGRFVAREVDAVAAGIAGLLADPPERAAVAALAEGFSWEANGAALEAHLRALV